MFFVLLALISGGIYNYSVVALGALYGTPVTVANAALTAYLALSALGVLVGGLLVTRTTRHGTGGGARACGDRGADRCSSPRSTSAACC